jgi:hypothetical protein
MKTSDFYYDLPKELIAQTPLEKRDESRLMTLDRVTGETEHRHFFELPQFLTPKDCLILNDSRVLPARLLGQRLPGGGACEVLLLIDRGNQTWECLVRPGRKMRPGARLSFGNGELTAEITDELEGGNRLVRFDYRGHFPGGAGASGQNAPAALHQGGASGSGALSDRLLQGAGQRRSTYGRSAFHQGTARQNSGSWALASAM